MSEFCDLFDSPDVNDLARFLTERDPHMALAASMDLTYRCNFGCTHCFCRLPADGPTPLAELSFEEWDRILGEAADEGVLFLTMTGGEPLLREDFPAIWRMAKRRGFVVELFSNAALVDAALADMFAEYTPKQISVTVYAASEESYRRMVGVPGMHARVLEGLDLLVDRGVPVEVKALFTRTNVHEFDAMREQALRYDDIFRWQAEMLGTYPGSGGTPQSVALTPTEIVELEQRDPLRGPEWERRLATWEPSPPLEGTPFRCTLGKGRFHLDPYGRMRACMLLESVHVDVRSTPLRVAWRELIPRALAAMPWKPSPCNVCEVADLCRVCPAKAILDGAPAGGPAAMYCELARARAAAYGLAAAPPPH